MEEEQQSEPPTYLRCPITLELLQDPVITEDGHTYSREAIAAWFRRNHDTSPVTGSRLISTRLVQNWTVKFVLEDFKKRAQKDFEVKLNTQRLLGVIELREQHIARMHGKFFETIFETKEKETKEKETKEKETKEKETNADDLPGDDEMDLDHDPPSSRKRGSRKKRKRGPSGAPCTQVSKKAKTRQSASAAGQGYFGTLELRDQKIQIEDIAYICPGHSSAKMTFSKVEFHGDVFLDLSHTGHASFENCAFHGNVRVLGVRNSDENENMSLGEAQFSQCSVANGLSGRFLAQVTFNECELTSFHKSSAVQASNGLQLIATDSKLTTSSAYGVQAWYQAQATLTRCQISRTSKKRGSVGVKIWKCGQVHISECKLSNWNIGIKSVGNPVGVNVQGCSFDRCKEDVSIRDARGNIVTIAQAAREL